MKLKKIKAIFQKIWQNLIIKLDQKKKKKKRKKIRKINTFDNISALYEGQELTLNAFKSGIFSNKSSKR